MALAARTWAVPLVRLGLLPLGLAPMGCSLRGVVGREPLLRGRPVGMVLPVKTVRPGTVILHAVPSMAPLRALNQGQASLAPRGLWRAAVVVPRRRRHPYSGPSSFWSTCAASAASLTPCSTA